MRNWHQKVFRRKPIDKLQPIILLSGSNEEKLATLKNVLAASEDWPERSRRKVSLS